MTSDLGAVYRLCRVEQVMGLPVSIDVRDTCAGVDEAIDDAFAWLREVDARFSPFRSDSELRRLERGELDGRSMSRDMVEVLGLCADYQARSCGAFRARLPGRGLDPSAVVKGWAVQRAADQLRSAGLGAFCLNAGGDVVVAGEPEPGRPWLVGVRHPVHSGRMCVVFGLRGGAVATSAAYERGHHILDGRTGRPARGLLSLTVVAADLTTADATATAGYALGVDGPVWAASQPGCEVYAVDDHRRVLRSSGLDRVITTGQPPA